MLIEYWGHIPFAPRRDWGERHFYKIPFPSLAFCTNPRTIAWMAPPPLRAFWRPDRGSWHPLWSEFSIFFSFSFLCSTALSRCSAMSQRFFLFSPVKNALEKTFTEWLQNEAFHSLSPAPHYCLVASRNRILLPQWSSYQRTPQKFWTVLFIYLFLSFQFFFFFKSFRSVIVSSSKWSTALTQTSRRACSFPQRPKGSLPTAHEVFPSGDSECPTGMPSPRPSSTMFRDMGIAGLKCREGIHFYY